MTDLKLKPLVRSWVQVRNVYPTSRFPTVFRAVLVALQLLIFLGLTGILNPNETHHRTTEPKVDGSSPSRCIG